MRMNAWERVCFLVSFGAGFVSLALLMVGLAAGPGADDTVLVWALMAGAVAIGAYGAMLFGAILKDYW